MEHSLFSSRSEKSKAGSTASAHAHKLSEKINTINHQIRRNIGGASVIASLHVLLWTSLYITAGGIYIITRGLAEDGVLTSTALMISTAVLSIFYVISHNYTCYLSSRTTTESRHKLRLRSQWLSKMCIRLMLVAWLVVCALIIIFTTARHPNCTPGMKSHIGIVDRGTVCWIQRSSVAASLLALLTSILLFVLTCRVTEPYRYHLFGVNKQQATLPFLLPYNVSGNRPMFSEMSFKCRSSTSLSSKTLVHSFSDSRTTLLPAQPATEGLGIYASKSRAPSFLAPRPSLSSIRSYTEAISAQPPSSPLPPLPVYRLDKNHRVSAAHAGRPMSGRPARYIGVRRERTLRIVPPSPTLPTTHLSTFSKSQVSLSSVYSQDPSGRRYSAGCDVPNGLHGSFSYLYSPDSGATVVKGALHAPKLVEYAGVFPTRTVQSMQATEHLDSDINDAASLQAKLPAVRAVSTFGIQDWTCGSEARANYYQRLIQPEHSGCRRALSFRPLLMRKTRNSGLICGVV